MFRCNASRLIRFSSKGDPHEHIHSHDFLRQRLHNPRILGTLVAHSRPFSIGEGRYAAGIGVRSGA